MGSTRIAYVTGGMGGIGTAICRRLCKEGHTVIAGCGPGSTRKDRWLSDMRAEGCKIHASEGNVADWDSTKRAFEIARAEVGEIDILVNNAGVSWFGPTDELDVDSYDAMFVANVRAPYYLVAALAPKMVARGSGSI